MVMSFFIDRPNLGLPVLVIQVDRHELLAVQVKRGEPLRHLSPRPVDHFALLPSVNVCRVFS